MSAIDNDQAYCGAVRVRATVLSSGFTGVGVIVASSLGVNGNRGSVTAIGNSAACHGRPVRGEPPMRQLKRSAAFPQGSGPLPPTPLERSPQQCGGLSLLVASRRS